MRILVVSDTHGYNDPLKQVLKKEGKVDYLIHCGDLEGGEDAIRRLAGCPCIMVSGNNDWYARLPKEIFTELGGKKFWITHGHTYGIYSSYNHIRTAGRMKKADIVLFGHTHIPYLEQTDRMLLANPGSLSYPRQSDRRPSYLVLELSEDGSITARAEKL